MNKYNIYGFIICLLYINFVFKNKAGEPPKRFNISFGNIIKNGSIYLFNKHIHHWLISLIILCFTFKKNDQIIFGIINGFLFLFLIHGLSYKDCFEFFD